MIYYSVECNDCEESFFFSPICVFMSRMGSAKAQHQWCGSLTLLVRNVNSNAIEVLTHYYTMLDCQQLIAKRGYNCQNQI